MRDSFLNLDALRQEFDEVMAMLLRENPGRTPESLWEGASEFARLVAARELVKACETLAKTGALP